MQMTKPTITIISIVRKLIDKPIHRKFDENLYQSEMRFFQLKA
jgi:hypothetical protein